MYICTVFKSFKPRNFTIMKKIKSRAIFLFLVMGMTYGISAQAPYRHSIGITVGAYENISLTYKTFFTDHLAFQLDFGYKYSIGLRRWCGSSEAIFYFSVDLNPNLMYESHFTKGLYGFVGGGGIIGPSWDWDNYERWRYDPRYLCEYIKFGVNCIFGLEYKFKIPLTLQFDLRAGYSYRFAIIPLDEHLFDWNANFGIRYAF